MRSRIGLSGFPVNSMLTTELTILLEFEPVWRPSPVLSSCIVTAFTCITGKYNNISHGCNVPSTIGDQQRVADNPLCSSPITRHPSLVTHHSLPITRYSLEVNYSMISEIVPAPTVTRPSLTANRNCGSIAIGLPSSISRFTLSPGMTIDTPSGSCTVPVTSVVLK